VRIHFIAFNVKKVLGRRYVSDMQRFSLVPHILQLQSEDHFFMLQSKSEINEHDEVSESLRNISQFIYSTSKLCKNVASQGRFVICCRETTVVIALCINPLNAELNPICHLLALLGAHHILHVSGVRVKRCLSNRREYSEKIYIVKLSCQKKQEIAWSSSPPSVH
jgi:hypothetical protein